MKDVCGSSGNDSGVLFVAETVIMAVISEKEHVENIEHNPLGDTIQNGNPVHNHLSIPLPTHDLNDPLVGYP
jgi:hypothetical protein